MKLNNKFSVKYSLVTICAFALIIVIDRFVLSRSDEKLLEISKNDAINIKITKSYYNRGQWVLNDSIILCSGCISCIDKNENLAEVSRYPLPFFVKKRKNSDTIILVADKDTSYLIFE